MSSLSASDQRRSDNLNSLVQTLFNRAGLKESTKQQHYSSILSYCVRLLSAGLGNAKVVDEVTIVQNAHHQLEGRGRKEAAQRFVELCSRLEKLKLLSNSSRSSVLYTLYNLSSLQSKPSLYQGALLPNLTLAKAPVASSSRPRSSSQSSNGDYTVSLPPSVASSVEGSLRHQAKAEGPSLLASLQGDGAASGGQNLRQKLSTYAMTFSPQEGEMVRDVLWNSQGLEGKHTVLMSNGEGFTSRPGVKITKDEKTMTLCQSELGWLFMKVKAHVEEGMDGQGVVRQALCAAFQGEIKDFYRLMAVLESQTLYPAPVPGQTDAGSATVPYLTLRRLHIWLSEPTKRLRLLAAMADATQGLRGGQLLGAVHAMSQHGDPLTVGFVSRVLQRCCAPLLEMVRGWVFEGRLHDPHQEFFIARNERLAEDMGAELWMEGWSIVESRLPPFIAQPLAQRILRAGKSIHFLQQACGDRKWVQQRALAAAAAVASSGSILKVEELEAVVNDAAEAVDRRVMEVLQGRFQFGKHCEAIRRYLLFSQGDFVSALIDQVSEELDKEAKRVSEMSLAHCLRGAITASSAKYDEEDVLDCLRARRERAVGDTETGWGVFTLNYELEGPLRAVLTSTAMGRYQRVFQLLLAMRHVEATLASSWLVLKSEVERALLRMKRIVREPTGADKITALERRCLQLRNEMSHFVTNFQVYIMFEVLEGAWQDFHRKAAAASDLDQLVAAHEEYQETLLAKALLGPESEELMTLLRAMFSQMLHLKPLVTAFSEAVRTAESLLKSRNQQAQKNTAKGGWGSTTTDTFFLDMVDELRELDINVAELERRYQSHLANFTRALPAQAHVEVRFLLYRLDFSDFYNKRRSTTEDASLDAMNHSPLS